MFAVLLPGVLQCVAFSCSVLQSVVVRAGLSALCAPCFCQVCCRCASGRFLCVGLSMFECGASQGRRVFFCSVLSCVAVCCSLVQSGAVCGTFQKRRHLSCLALHLRLRLLRSILQRTATHCNTLQHRLTLHVRLRLRL